METCAYFYASGAALERLLPREAAAVREVTAVTARRWRLCALNGAGVARLGNGALRCDTLLLPEGACPDGARARQVVSYGLGGRNTLTLSSMDTRPMLCVQRTIENLRGETVEVQELALPADWACFPKEQMLALAGICLLCGGW